MPQNPESTIQDLTKFLDVEMSRRDVLKAAAAFGLFGCRPNGPKSSEIITMSSDNFYIYMGEPIKSEKVGKSMFLPASEIGLQDTEGNIPVLSKDGIAKIVYLDPEKKSYIFDIGKPNNGTQATFNNMQIETLLDNNAIFTVTNPVLDLKAERGFQDKANALSSVDKKTPTKLIITEKLTKFLSKSQSFEFLAKVTGDEKGVEYSAAFKLSKIFGKNAITVRLLNGNKSVKTFYLEDLLDDQDNASVVDLSDLVKETNSEGEKLKAKISTYEEKNIKGLNIEEVPMGSNFTAEVFTIPNEMKDSMYMANIKGKDGVIIARFFVPESLMKGFKLDNSLDRDWAGTLNNLFELSDDEQTLNFRGGRNTYNYTGLFLSTIEGTDTPSLKLRTLEYASSSDKGSFTTPDLRIEMIAGEGISGSVKAFYSDGRENLECIDKDNFLGFMLTKRNGLAKEDGLNPPEGDSSTKKSLELFFNKGLTGDFAIISNPGDQEIFKGIYFNYHDISRDFLYK